MKTIIKYFKQDNSHTLWGKILAVGTLLFCGVVSVYLISLVIFNDVITLLEDMPIWAITIYVSITLSYIAVGIKVYKEIKNEVITNDDN